MGRFRAGPVLLVCAGLVFAGCSRFAVRSAKDPAADFRNVRTYAWLPIEEAAPADQRVQDRYLDRRLRSAVGTQLRARGIVAAPFDQQPDILLNYRLSTSAATGLRANPDMHFGGSAWLGWPYASALASESYDQGALYIAVIDPRSRRMIWVGVAEARLVPTMSLDRKAKRVDDAARSILAGFPPR